VRVLQAGADPALPQDALAGLLQRAAAGRTPDPSGPTVAQWRRVWEQTESPVVDSGAPAPRAWRRSR